MENFVSNQTKLKIYFYAFTENTEIELTKLNEVNPTGLY